MKRIAIPITTNNQIEAHFGHCEFYEIYTFSNTNEIVDLQLLKSEQGCGGKSKDAALLASGGVTMLLSNAIGDKAVYKLTKAGIKVIRGCSGDSADVVLQFIDGAISDNGISCSYHNHKHKVGHYSRCKH